MSVKSMTKELGTRIKLLNDLTSSGEISTLIDKKYGLEEYREAHSHVYSKHKVGNVVIEIKKEVSL